MSNKDDGINPRYGFGITTASSRTEENNEPWVDASVAVYAVSTPDVSGLCHPTTSVYPPYMQQPTAYDVVQELTRLLSEERQERRALQKRLDKVLEKLARKR